MFLKMFADNVVIIFGSTEESLFFYSAASFLLNFLRYHCILKSEEKNIRYCTRLCTGIVTITHTDGHIERRPNQGITLFSDIRFLFSWSIFMSICFLIRASLWLSAVSGQTQNSELQRPSTRTNTSSLSFLFPRWVAGSLQRYAISAIAVVSFRPST